MAPLFDYLPAEALCVVEDPEAVARRGAPQRRRGCARPRPPGAPSTAWRWPRDGLRAARGRGGGGAGGAPAAGAAHRRGDARARRGATRPTCAAARARRVGAAHDAARRAAAGARRRADGATKPDGIDIGRPLRDRMRAWLDAGHRVRLVAHNRTHADRLAALFARAGPGDRRLAGAGQRRLTGAAGAAADAGGADRSAAPRLPRCRPTGWCWSPRRRSSDRARTREARAVKTPASRRSGRDRRGRPSSCTTSTASAATAGLKKLEVRGVPQDFLHLEYDGGSVYVPVYRIGARPPLRRRRRRPTSELDKLGGKTWQEKRRRVSAEARKIAEELLQLYAQRAALPGHAFPAPDAIVPRVRGDVPVRGDARPGRRRSTPCSPTCRRACRWTA